jgi:hypothetical protein
VEQEELERLSVGQRDGLLLALRRHLYGPTVLGVTSCPRCREQVEVSFDLADIAVDPPGDPREPIEVELGGYRVRARPPGAMDLVSVADARDHLDPRTALIERCVLEAGTEQGPMSAPDLPPAVVSCLASALAEADPQADVRLALGCPGCGHEWTAAFDIVAFLWAELDAWGYRVLGDVHVLASAYGWREADIVAMSEWRRTHYLERVGW